MKKVMKRYSKGALDLTKGSVILGVGSTVVHQAGGNAGGLNAMAGYLPVMGTTMGAGAVFGAVKYLNKSTKYKKK